MQYFSLFPLLAMYKTPRALAHRLSKLVTQENMLGSRHRARLTLNTVAKLLIQNSNFSSSPEYQHYLDVTIDELEPEHIEQLKRFSPKLRTRSQRQMAEFTLAKSSLGPDLANRICW